MKEIESLNEISISETLKFVDEQLFVLSRKDFRENTNILFGTKIFLMLLAEAECWLTRKLATRSCHYYST